MREYAVIEDYLQGVEISVLAAVTEEKHDSMEVCIVPLYQRDHKRLLDAAQVPIPVECAIVLSMI